MDKSDLKFAVLISLFGNHSEVFIFVSTASTSRSASVCSAEPTVRGCACATSTLKSKRSGTLSHACCCPTTPRAGLPPFASELLHDALYGVFASPVAGELR